MAKGCLNRQEVLLLGREEIVYLFDAVIRSRLDFLFATLEIVFGDLSILLQLLNGIHGVVTRLSDSHAGVLGMFAHQFNELLSPISGKLWEGKPDYVCLLYTSPSPRDRG